MLSPRQIKLRYGCKKFGLYTAIGLIGTNIIPGFGMLVGGIPVIFGAAFLAIADASSLNAAGLAKAPPVFTRPYRVAIALEAATVIILGIST